MTPAISPSETSNAAGLPPELTFERITTVRSAAFEALADFVVRNPKGWLEAQGREPTRDDAIALLQRRPEGVTHEQKYLWGLHRGGELVGHIEVLRDFPEGELCIGSLAIAERLQRQGLGRASLAQLAQRTRAWKNIRVWHVALNETQRGAHAFWRQNGFAETGQRGTAPNNGAPLVVMERRVLRAL